MAVQFSHRFFKQDVAQSIKTELAEKGYTFIRQAQHDLCPEYQSKLQNYRSEYAHFPKDNHLFDGEGDRVRTYARFKVDPLTNNMEIFPHDTFFQSSTFDELYGDIHRRFAPLTRELIHNDFFLELIKNDFNTFPLSAEKKAEPWEISTHLIRIAAVPGNDVARPAPEGIHQDGYHYGVARLFNRVNLKGAESRVHNLDKEVIDRTYLTEPLDALYMNDRAIYHSVQPFEAAEPDTVGFRDMLIALYQPLSESPQPKVESLPLTPSGKQAYLNFDLTSFDWQST